jgi:hypothetical protein
MNQEEAYKEVVEMLLEKLPSVAILHKMMGER